MNREILFRGKRIDNGEWVNGYYMDEGYINIPFTDNDVGGRFDDPVQVDPETVGQYAGYDPVCGRLFDGDIFIPLGEEAKMQIFWHQEKLRWSCVAMGIGYVNALSDYIENGISKVIGNIHDNPSWKVRDK